MMRKEKTIRTAVPLPLTHARNVRDIGCYCDRNGGKLREGRFLRADALGRLDDREWKFLKDYGVTLIVDLRSPMEREQEPFGREAEAAGIRYHSVPMFDNIQSNDGTEEFPSSLHDLYIRMLDKNGAQIREVLREFLKNEEGCCLFNCTAGKDRTGVIAMLLLGLADVEDDTIIADYSVSAENMKHLFEGQIRAMKQAGYGNLCFLLESDPEDMRLTLRFLNERYGNARKYVANLLTEDEVERLGRMLAG